MHQSISPPGGAIDAFRELNDSVGLRKYALTEEEKVENEMI
jgi:hypothetical protein